MTMISRREFLVGGVAGLAGGAMGRPIRGCIGANPHSEKGGGGHSAADYVQDGLVAMFDGIENVEWNEHDASATTWLDLISGTSSASLAGKGSFSQDSFAFSDRAISLLNTDAMRNAIYSSVFTAEAVYSSSAFNSAVFSWGSPRGFQFTTLSDYALRFYSGGTIIAQTGAAYATIRHTYSIARDGVVAVAYSDGASLGAKECAFPGIPSAGLDIPNGRDVCCIRIYSCALTAAEIAHNYTIDQARFGI